MGTVRSPEIWEWLFRYDHPLRRDRYDVAVQHASDLGLVVEWVDLGPRRRGECRWREGVLVLNPRLTMSEAACTLIHEVAHAVFGDDESSVAIERRAWEYGASLLVEADEYARAESIVGSDARALALELDVTVRLVESWRAWWKRRGHLSQGDRLEGV